MSMDLQGLFLKYIIMFSFALAGILGQNENPFDRPEVLDYVLPTQGVTLDPTTGKVSAIASGKGLMSLAQATDANRVGLVTYGSTLAFNVTGGAQRMDSVAPFPQAQFSAMVCFYGSNGSAFCNKQSAGYINFGVTSNVASISNSVGTILAGAKSLVSNNTLRTVYWSKAANGFKTGVDGTPDTDNATVISSDPSGAFRLFNQHNGANALIGMHVGIVWFNRDLTDDEQEFWRSYLKSRPLYGYRGITPFDGGYDSIDTVLAHWDFNGWSAVSGTAAWKSFYDTTKTIVKGANVVRLENPQRISPSTAVVHQTKAHWLFSATSTGMTRSIVQSQPFTVAFCVCINPYQMMSAVTQNKIFHYLNGANLVACYVDQVTGKIRMQSQGAIGSSGIEANYTKHKWMVICATFNGASSELIVDIDGTRQTITGDLGGTTGLAGSVEFGENLSGLLANGFFLFDGAANSTQKESMIGLLKAQRNYLPRYDNCAFIAGDDTAANYHRAFGGICEADNGDLIVVYRRGSAHASNDGDIYLSRSTDLGDSFPSESLVFSPSVGDDARDPRITKLVSGRIIVNFFVRNVPVDLGAQSYTMYSDDHGNTWSTPVALAPEASYYDLRVSGYIIEQGNGDLLCPFHTEDAGTTNLRVGVFRSTNQGVSWNLDSVINDITPGTSLDFEEFNIRILDDGTVLGLIRYETATDKQILKTVGTLDGSNAITWTVPSLAIDNVFGSPGFIQDSDGLLRLTARLEFSEYAGGYYTSSDRGATWTQGEYPMPTADYWVYGAPFELSDGRICVLDFIESQWYAGSVAIFGKSVGRVKFI